jgi:predicted secreted hydrolase
VQKAVILAISGILCLAGGSQPSPAAQSITETLANPKTEGYARAMAPRPFAFPADHGPHPEYRTEWWYFTGNLEDAGGRAFGYELTFFRIGLSPRPVPTGSAWRANQMFMAHFALTDVEGKRFHAHERFSRAALGLAGAKADTLHVWLEDWSAKPQGPEVFPLRLQAAEESIAIDLVLEQGKAPVLHGEQGLSQKSPEPGNASYYYSLTRMPTAGTLRVDGKDFRVRGESWLDREWSTSALGKDQAGWDWFALQLSDNRELMFYRLRRKDGGTDPMSAGTLIDHNGQTRSLTRTDVEIETLADWSSPRSGARYPARWRFRVPKEGLDLEIRPLLPDQELNVSVRYWEGAVRISGHAAGQPIEGRGYVELTGYAGSGGIGGFDQAAEGRQGIGQRE